MALQKEKAYQEGKKRLIQELLIKEKENQEGEKKLREELLTKEKEYLQEVHKLKEEFLYKSVELTQSQITMSYLKSQIPDDKKDNALTKLIIEWSASAPTGK
jgi:hypothetical protein